MKAVETDIAYVQSSTCHCCTYHTYWELLCNQLFCQYEPGISEADTFDEVKVWHEGIISMISTQSPYTFSMTIDEGVDAPKASDVIFYERKFYIIGAVEAGEEENTYICSNCIRIDLSIVGAYVALIQLNDSITAAEGLRVTAEQARVIAEASRVLAETAREGAEASRAAAYTVAEASRDSSYTAAEATRQAAFDAAEQERTEDLEGITDRYLTPWIVAGTIASGSRQFTPTGSESVAVAKTRFYAGKRTYLQVDGYGTEDIIADDGAFLITRSGWKWKY